MLRADIIFGKDTVSFIGSTVRNELFRRFAGPGCGVWRLDVRAEMTLIFGRMLRANSLICSRLRTLLLPEGHAPNSSSI